LFTSRIIGSNKTSRAARDLMLFTSGALTYNRANKKQGARGCDPTQSRTAMTKDHASADVAFIKALAELLNANDLTEIAVEREYGEHDMLSVRVAKQAQGATSVHYAPAPAQHGAPVASPVASPAPPAASADPAEHPGAVTSPMVGTAYLAAEPGTDPFVTVGAQVSAGQTLLIIEAMKTMNHIPAPHSGVVKRILISDGTAVEYGAPLMIIE